MGERLELSTFQVAPSPRVLRAGEAQRNSDQGEGQIFRTRSPRRLRSNGHGPGVSQVGFYSVFDQSSFCTP